MKVATSALSGQAFEREGAREVEQNIASPNRFSLPVLAKRHRRNVKEGKQSAVFGLQGINNVEGTDKPKNDQVLTIPNDNKQIMNEHGLRFYDAWLEHEFQLYYSRIYAPTMRMNLTLALVIWFFLPINDYFKNLQGKRLDFEKTMIVWGVAALLQSAILAALVMTSKNAKFSQPLVACSISIMVVASLLFGEIEKNILDPTYCINVLFAASVASTFFRLSFHVCIFLLWLLLAYYVVFTIKGTEQERIYIQEWSQVFFVLFVGNTFFTWQAYQREYFLRIGWIQGQRVRLEEKKTQSILKLMLPIYIVDQLRAGAALICEKHAECTIMFVHISDFEMHIQNLSAYDMIKWLNMIFTHFDGLVDEYNVFKVETVGDVYLVASGCPFFRKDHALAACLVAADFRSSMLMYQISDYKGELDLQIGLNTGPVMAGVVGVKYPRYRIMGDTVNTASRMSTTDTIGGLIQMSYATWTALGDARNVFDISSRGQKTVKGLGLMELFLLNNLNHKALALKQETNKSFKRHSSHHDPIAAGTAVNAGATVRQAAMNIDTQIKTSQGEDGILTFGRLRTKHISSRKLTPLSLASPSGRKKPASLKEGIEGKTEEESIHKNQTHLNQIGGTPDFHSRSIQSSRNLERRTSMGDDTHAFAVSDVWLQFHHTATDKTLASHEGALLEEMNNRGTLRRVPTDPLPEDSEMEALPGRIFGNYDVELQMQHPEPKLWWIFNPIQLKKWLNPSFTSPVVEKHFLDDYVRRMAHGSKLAVSMICVASFFFGLLDAMAGVYLEVTSQTISHIWIARGIGLAAAATYFLIILYARKLFDRNHQLLTTLTMTIQGVTFLYAGIAREKGNNGEMIGCLLLFGSITTCHSGLRFASAVTVAVVVLVSFILDSVVTSGTFPWVSGYLLVSYGVFLLASQKNEWYMRAVFLAECKQRNETARIRQFLSHMLPPVVLEEIRGGNSCIAHSHPTASFLQTDIVGFTVLAARMQPHDVVALLSMLFTQFDELTVECNVYKVETVGDAYLACSGVIFQQREFTRNLIEFTLECQLVVQSMRCPDGKKIQMRAGIHTGPVIAGVVGRKMPRYHLFGETVAIAEKLESTGIPEKVVISGPTVRQLQDTDTHDIFVLEQLEDLPWHQVGVMALDTRRFVVDYRPGDKDTQ